jgi:hypothetical protein
MPPPREGVAEIVAESNRLRIRHDAASVRSLERLLSKTASDVRQSIIRTPRGLIGERYRRDLMASLEATLNTFRDEYKEILNSGILAGAKLAEDRERAVLDEVLKTRKNLTFDQFTATFTQQGKTVSEVSIQFGQVPVKALEKLYERTYKDGLKLSQRLYNLDQATRFEMRDIVARGLATGQSARKMAAEFAPILEKTGVDNVRYKAMRIARTEINMAFREGHIASATDAQGKLQPWIAAIGWRLSASHPRVCICDVWADDDSAGLGPGNYLPGDVPPGHPHCMCYTVSILASMPEEQFVSKAPQPDEVPSSQRKYYGFDTEE